MGRRRSGWNEDWCTPDEYLDSIRRFFGGAIALDPCSNKWSRVTAGSEWLLPRSDGLKCEWDFPTIFVHPPYGGRLGTKLSPWLAKCSDASRRHLSEVVALVPVEINSAAWQRDVWNAARSVCFIFSQRIRFLECGRPLESGAKASYAFVYWGNAHSRFEEEFRAFGAVVDLVDAKLPGPGNAHRFRLLAPAPRGR